MFDHLLESSRWDDSNKWSNIGFGEEMGILEIEIRILYGALRMALFLQGKGHYGDKETWEQNGKMNHV